VLTLKRILVALAVLIGFPLALFAQAAADPAGGASASLPLCVVLGPVITAVLQPFKHIPFIKNNTFLLSVIASTVLNLSPQLGGATGLSVGAIIGCILTTLGGATLTHRALIKPVEQGKPDPMNRMVDIFEKQFAGPAPFAVTPAAPKKK